MRTERDPAREPERSPFGGNPCCVIFKNRSTLKLYLLSTPLVKTRHCFTEKGSGAQKGEGPPATGFPGHGHERGARPQVPAAGQDPKGAGGATAPRPATRLRDGVSPHRPAASPDGVPALKSRHPRGLPGPRPSAAALETVRGGRAQGHVPVAPEKGNGVRTGRHRPGPSTTGPARPLERGARGGPHPRGRGARGGPHPRGRARPPPRASVAPPPAAAKPARDPAPRFRHVLGGRPRK